MAKSSKKIVKVGRIGIIPIVIAIGIFSYWYIQRSITSNSTESYITFIQEHFNSKGELIDYFGEIGVEDINDIKLYVRDDEVEIDFGNIVLSWTLEEFVAEDNLEALEKIYIDVYKDKETGKLRIFYKGEELERWVS